MTKKTITEKLKSPNTISVMTFGYYYPRTQKELGELIYKKKSKEIAFNPLIDGRESLMENGIIKNLKFMTMKNIKYKTDVKILINHLKETVKIKRKKSNNPDLYNLKNEEWVLLENFLDSDWFRSFFSGESLDLMIDNWNNIGRDENDKLWVSNLFKVILHMSMIFFAISIAFDKKGLLPEMKDIEKIKYRTFEEFSQLWYEQNLKEKVDEVKIKKVLSDLESYPSKFIAHLAKKGLEKPYYVLCLPSKFWDVFHQLVWYTSYVFFTTDSVKNNY